MLALLVTKKLWCACVCVSLLKMDSTDVFECVILGLVILFIYYNRRRRQTSEDRCADRPEKSENGNKAPPRIVSRELSDPMKARLVYAGVNI